MPFAGEHRTYLRRWSISAAIVVLVYVGIAGAILAWQKVVSPVDLSSSVTVELTPEPAAPVAGPAKPLTAPAQAPVTASPPQSNVRSEERTASRGDAASEASPSSVPSPGAVAPLAVGPSSIPIEGNAGSGVPGGVPPAGVTNQGVAGPIDTQLANPNLRPKGTTPSDWKKALLAHPAKPFGAWQPPHAPLAGTNVETRNAIGALAQSRPGATGVFGTTPGSAGNRTVTNAIGEILPAPVNTQATDVRSANPGRAPGSIPSPSGSISGTNISRSGAGAGSIGGATKDTSGALNGTSFRPKSP
jgi:hypothetical protein